MHYDHPECPAYDVSLALQRAQRPGQLLAVGMSRQVPPAVNQRRPARIPPVAWLGWVIAAALLFNLLGCGAPRSRVLAPPAGSGAGSAASLVRQVDEIGARLQRNRERIAFWRGVQFRANPALALREAP